MSEPKDLQVILTIPTADDQDVTLNVTATEGQSITEEEVVYYLFQTAASILSAMPEKNRATTIELIEGFFE